jgi:hypothetical protein
MMRVDAAARAGSLRRKCRYEQFEPRLLLAADAAWAVPAAAQAGELSATTVVAPQATASLAGRVIVAEACGDVPHASAPGIEGVRIRLLGPQGELLAEQLTDGSGDFRFAGLTPGLYALQQVQPSAWADGACCVGSGGGQQLAANLIGEIEVGADDQHVGYVFCERPVGADEVPSNGDRAIEPMQRGGATAAASWPAQAWLELPAVHARKSPQEAFLPLVAATPVASFVGPLLSGSETAARVWEPIFGGSSQRLAGEAAADGEPQGDTELQRTAFDLVATDSVARQAPRQTTAAETHAEGEELAAEAVMLETDVEAEAQEPLLADAQSDPA